MKETASNADAEPKRQPYCTDLNDAQWQRVCAEVFETTADWETRETINGLLYQERTRLRWDMLPLDLPAGAKLKATASVWRRDGTWPSICAIVDAEPENAPRRFDSLRKLKKKCALVLRRLRGGTAVLWAARTAIHSARRTRQWLRQKWTGHLDAQLLLIEADKQLSQQRLAAAVELYTAYMNFDPLRPQAHMHRCWANYGLERYEDSCADAWRLLALPACPDHHRMYAYNSLYSSMVKRRDSDRALSYRFFAAWYKRFPHNLHGLYQRENFDDDAAGLETLVACQLELAEETINTFSDFSTGLAIYRKRAQHQQTYLDRFAHLPDQEKTLYLPADWVRNIGHMAYLDFWVKMSWMGWKPYNHFVLVAPPHATANQWYANYWRKYYAIVEDQRLVEVMNHFADTLGDRVSSRLVLPNGSETYFCEGMGAIQEAWEAKNLPPLIKLTDEDRDFGMEQRRSLGMPDDAWFVCLHVRSPGFHKEGGNAHQAHRNADIMTYLPAIREIVSRGGWVIRMGDRTMPPLPEMEGVIDYAHSPVKSQRMDIALCASCRFFVGVASGLSHIPTTFGVPCVMTNWCSNAFPVYSRHDLFLPKLESSIAGGGVLSFSKWLAPECRSWSYAGVTLNAHGIRALDNTEDELREVVMEMADRLDGRAEYTQEDRSRLAAFNSIATNNGLIGYSQIGRDFMRRHAHLLLDDNSDRSTREIERLCSSAA